MREASITRPPYYAESLDFEALTEEFPPPPQFFHTVYAASRDELVELQNRRLRQQIRRASDIPFYQRLWANHGVDPNAVRTVEDLRLLPTFSVDEIRDSLEQYPPFGDFMGVDPRDGTRMPLVIQTSGGTTGLPRPMIYTPRDREVMAILGARRLALHGVRPGDLVQVTRALGLPNGGFHVREALWKYCGAIPVMTGTGNITPTRRQVEILQAWGVSALIGFPAYLRHMALVARDEMGIDPRSLGVRTMDSSLGNEPRETIESLWGAPIFDHYGAHEAGMLAAECSYQTGPHIQEDAFVIEILDEGTGTPVPEGADGAICVTTLFKFSAPLIRYNIRDLSAIVPGTCPCLSGFRRLRGIHGRSDNMVKLRGVNVFPEAIGRLIAEDPETNGEFLCFVERTGRSGRDEMTVSVERVAQDVNASDLQHRLERRLHEVLSVRVMVKVVAAGELASLTRLKEVNKPKRLIDRRAD